MDKREMSKYVNRVYIDMQIDEILPLETYELYIKANFNTASWRILNGKHQIILGMDIFKNMKSDGSDLEKKNYLKAYLHHELAHSIWTKEVHSVSAILKEEGYAFEVFNLFEDARIEDKMRHHIKSRFNWDKYELLDSPPSPLQMFFFILQCERKKTTIDSLKKTLNPEELETFKVVYKFYSQALKMSSSMNIIDLVQYWYEIFPDTPKDVKSLEDESHIFVLESKSLGDDEVFDELIKGLDNVLGVTPGDTPCKIINPKKSNLDISDTKSTNLLVDEAVDFTFDTKQRDMLLKKMQEIFLAPLRYESTQIASKRLDLKKILKGDPKIFRRKSLSCVHKKKITIILDLSGSMYECISDMRLLVDVLDKMALNDIIEATLILTGVELCNAIFQVLEMPLNKGVIERIVPKYSAEGLDNTMKKNIDTLKRSDYVWILTDGYIDDKPLDKSYYNKLSVKTHAMYIGDVSCKEMMEKSFDEVICQSSVEKLARDIFRLIK